MFSSLTQTRTDCKRETSFHFQQVSLSFLFKPEIVILSKVKANEQWTESEKAVSLCLHEACPVISALSASQPRIAICQYLPEILGIIRNAAYVCEHSSVPQLINQVHLTLGWLAGEWWSFGGNSDSWEGQWPKQQHKFSYLSHFYLSTQNVPWDGYWHVCLLRGGNTEYAGLDYQTWWKFDCLYTCN